jgi:hypothetical protein
VSTSDAPARKKPTALATARRERDEARDRADHLADLLQYVQGATRLLARAVISGHDDAARGIAHGVLQDPEATAGPMRRVDDGWVWDSWHAKLLAMACAETIRTRPPDDPKHGEPLNYLQFRLSTGDGLRLAVTVQRMDGKTPAEIAGDAKAETARLREALERCAADVGRLPDCRAHDDCPCSAHHARRVLLDGGRDG